MLAGLLGWRPGTQVVNWLAARHPGVPLAVAIMLN